MRSARTLMATAAAAAVLVLGAPGAYASGGWDDTDSSYSKEQDKGQETGQEKGQEKETTGTTLQDERSWSGKQEGESWSGKQDEGSWSGKQEKPSGGMHTGGGGLASPAVTAGGLAVLAVAGTGLYAARRRKTAGSVA
ncbi:hypothetical protein ABT147_20475 [Streptomyces sp. NPDC001868]|uniref:hypothetical protein n=1 Tax=Streptomyces sp. NPDC001868 TaxID=3154401 RepID=UPI00333088C1